MAVLLGFALIAGVLAGGAYIYKKAATLEKSICQGDGFYPGPSICEEDQVDK